MSAHDDKLSPPVISPTTNEEIADILKLHNDYRARHGSPPLAWDARCFDTALHWATYLLDDKKKVEKCKGNGFGQNISWSAYGAGFQIHDALRKWYSEVNIMETENDHKSGHLVFKSGEFKSETDKFSQMVWKDSTLVGIARVQRKNNVYIVAHYSPPGGNVHDSYKNNVFPLQVDQPSKKLPPRQSSSAHGSVVVSLDSHSTRHVKRSGQICISDVTDVDHLRSFIAHNGDFDEKVTVRFFPIVGLFVCTLGLGVAGIGVIVNLWPISLASIGIILFLVILELYYIFQCLRDLYRCKWLEYRPLHVAAMCDRMDIVEYLLDHGADPSIRATYSKATPADVASHVLAKEELVKMLLVAHLNLLDDSDEQYYKIEEALEECEINLKDVMANESMRESSMKRQRWSSRKSSATTAAGSRKSSATTAAGRGVSGDDHPALGSSHLGDSPSHVVVPIGHHITGDPSHTSGDASHIRVDASYVSGDASYVSGDASHVSGDASHVSGDATHTSGGTSHDDGTVTHHVSGGDVPVTEGEESRHGGGDGSVSHHASDHGDGLITHHVGGDSTSATHHDIPVGEEEKAAD